VQCNGSGTIGPGSYKYLQGGQLLNAGTLNWSDTIYTGGGSTPTLISNLLGATISLTAGAGTGNEGGTRTIVNNGTMTVTGSGTSAFSDLFNNAGTLNIQSGAVSLTGGCSLTNGTLSFGITDTTHFGKLNLSGQAGLTGTLGGTFNGYTPQIGDSFGLITYGSETGAFTAFNLPSPVNWQETYGSSVYTLSVAVAPPEVTLAPGQPAWTTNGFNLEVSGPGGSNYTILASANLVQTNWTALSNFVSTFTVSTFTDSAATNFYTNRFYRAVMR